MIGFVMRLFFCAVPALVCAAVVALFAPAAWAVVFVLVFILGVHATQARPEREEWRS